VEFRISARLTLALGAAVCLAALTTSCGSSNATRDEADTLLAQLFELTESQTALPRVIGLSPSTTGAHSQPAEAAYRLIETRARLELLATSKPSQRSLQAFGLAQVLAGNLDAGLGVLSEGLLHDQKSAVSWNMLGSGYLCAARRDRDRRDSFLVRGLDAFLRAQRIDPRLPDARFNVASALIEMGLTRYAQRELLAYIAVEPNARLRADADAIRNSLDRPHDWEPAHRSIHDGHASPPESQRIARTFPQATRECIELDLLNSWATRVLAETGGTRNDDLDRQLAMARTLAASVIDGGDPFLRDSLAAIDRASPSQRFKLADAHAAYVRAHALYESGQYEPAIALLTRARPQFVAAASPYVLRADLEMATLVYQQRDVAAARRLCERVLAEARAREYTTIAARAQWLRGITSLQASRFEDALRDYDAAAAAYTNLGEVENAASAASAAADTLRIIGDHTRGWRYLSGMTFRAFPETRSVRRRYVSLLNASLYASDERLEAAALFFQDASVEEAMARGVPNTIVESLSRRAALRLKDGNTVGAQADVTAAQSRLPEIQSAASRRYQGAWLDATAALVAARVSPEEAIQKLDAAIPTFQRIEPAEVPRLYLARGDAALASGHAEDAERSYLAAVEAFEQRWNGLAQDAHRVPYLEQGWPAYQKLIDMALRRDAVDLAFEYTERARARSLAALTAPTPQRVTLADVAHALDPSTLMLYYVMFDDRLVLWTITASGRRVSVMAISEATVARQVADFRKLLESGGDRPAVAALGRQLFDSFLKPALDELDRHRRVVIVPDGPLNELPFAALVDARSGRYLVDLCETAFSPSAKEFLFATVKLATPARAPLRVLAAGSQTPGADRLPAAERELRDVARVYKGSTLLAGSEASPARVTKLAPAFSIIHLAGHAQANAIQPALSFIQLAPGPNDDGRLYAAPITRWSLPATRLVVLSACETGAGGVYRAEGLVSLTRPFLAAGVPSIVATLWKIDDRAASSLMTHFHQAYAATGDAAQALASAQRQLLHDANPDLADPRQWAAFITVSGRVTESHTGQADMPRQE
jgi:CHAT domain-containing protein